MGWPEVCFWDEYFVDMNITITYSKGSVVSIVECGAAFSWSDKKEECKEGEVKDGNLFGVGMMKGVSEV
eukprot:14881113-Ditylum_brightwellii.AAC.1